MTMFVNKYNYLPEEKKTEPFSKTSFQISKDILKRKEIMIEIMRLLMLGGTYAAGKSFGFSLESLKSSGYCPLVLIMYLVISWILFGSLSNSSTSVLCEWQHITFLQLQKG